MCGYVAQFIFVSFLIIEPPFVYYDKTIASVSKAKVGIRVLDDKDCIITKLPVFLEGLVLFRGPLNTNISAATASPTTTTIKIAVKPPSIVYIAVVDVGTTSERLKDAPWNMGKWEEIGELNEIDHDIKVSGINLGIRTYRKRLYDRYEEARTGEAVLAIFIDEGRFCLMFR